MCQQLVWVKQRVCIERFDLATLKELDYFFVSIYPVWLDGFRFKREALDFELLDEFFKKRLWTSFADKKRAADLFLQI